MNRFTLLRIAALGGLLHLYLGMRLLPDLPIGTLGVAAGILWLLLSTLLSPAPLIARAVIGRPPPDWVAWLGYLMMGVFSSLFVLTFLRDVLLLGWSLFNWVVPKSLPVSTLDEPTAIAVLLLTGIVSLVGLFNARRLAKIVEVDLPIAGLPAALSGFSIVQISDIHVGHTIKHGYLQAIVQAVNALKPDMVAVTGDIVDGSVARLRSHVAPLGGLSAKHGVFGVTGNHEYYSGVDEWVTELERLGLRMLMNESTVLEHNGARLLIGGVTDFSGHVFDEAHRSDPIAALANAPRDVFVKLLLAHQPRSAAAASSAGFDVQLSGHTHGGQFLPWNYFVRLQQPFTSGLNRLDKLLVYTSRGTGYWGPPIRFGAPSEITLLRLVAQ